MAVHPLSHEGRGCVVDQREKMGPELPRHARCLGRCLFDSFLEGRGEVFRGGRVVSLGVDLAFPVATGDPRCVAIPAGGVSSCQFFEECLLGVAREEGAVALVPWEVGLGGVSSPPASSSAARGLRCAPEEPRRLETAFAWTFCGCPGVGGLQGRVGGQDRRVWIPGIPGVAGGGGWRGLAVPGYVVGLPVLPHWTACRRAAPRVW